MSTWTERHVILYGYGDPFQMFMKGTVQLENAWRAQSSQLCYGVGERI